MMDAVELSFLVENESKYIHCGSQTVHWLRKDDQFVTDVIGVYGARKNLTAYFMRASNFRNVCLRYILGSSITCQTTKMNNYFTSFIQYSSILAQVLYAAIEWKVKSYGCGLL